MRESIGQCIEEVEERILDVERGEAAITEALDTMGLSHMKLSSSQSSRCSTCSPTASRP
ncbi:hypothetical protein [Salidesulfovibrio brasiliensis]|uniref:hypothetical protein n=1 Tax=Salidesulfovibrio brasiliensis TaxID=221711 RepID=UPI001FE04097|nr:hypothetical protein [Salidesulfovibrio brasiliensis]